jgi:hypothetical protein
MRCSAIRAVTLLLTAGAVVACSARARGRAVTISGDSGDSDSISDDSGIGDGARIGVGIGVGPGGRVGRGVPVGGSA